MDTKTLKNCEVLSPEPAAELDGIDLSAVGDKPILVVHCPKDQVENMQQVLVPLWEELRKRTKVELALVLPHGVKLEELTDDELESRYRLYRKRSSVIVTPSSLVDASGKPLVG